jgi:GT2 family glycosyltransferase
VIQPSEHVRKSPPSDAPKVAVVVPIHNGIDQTRRLLDSLRGGTYPNLDVIVVDDGSTDGSSAILERDYPEVTVVTGSGDMWWTKATNAGVGTALARAADYVLTINNDAVMDRDAVTMMVEAARTHPRSLVGAQIYYLEDAGRVWFVGAYLDPATADISHRREPSDATDPIATGMLTGLGMLIPIGAFEEIGGLFDERFPQYFADCDFSLRARTVGYELLVEPRASIYNEVGSSWLIQTLRTRRWTAVGSMLFSFRSPYWIAGRVRFYRRHWGRGYKSALLRLYGRLAVRFFRAIAGGSLPDEDVLR